MLRSLLLLSSVLAFASFGSSTACGGDAVGQDKDQDGFPAESDCDDNDPAVYPGVRRSCQSECDVGAETCLTNGTWNTCTAPASCDCSSPLDTRIIVCGNCGQASQECGLDLKWSMPGTCLNQGECSPGESEDSPCPRCGVSTRLCSTECSWGAWDETGCLGDCTPGDARAVPSTETSGCEPWERTNEECSAECAWEVTLPCTAECASLARTGTLDFKDEVCVPGGLTFIGADPGEGYGLDSSVEPEHVVALSPYLIDVYEVTVARYRECVDAGACTLPQESMGSTYFEPASDDRPVTHVTWEQAMAFCSWDDGRSLPTEAQWEKAARGPHPIDVPNPWGTDPPTCDHVPARDCVLDPVTVDANPAGASYYGVHQMAGNAAEWVSDWMGDYATVVGVPLDPSYPPPDGQRYVRGLDADTLLISFADASTVTFRDYRYTGMLNYYLVGFRCARFDQ